LSPLSCFFANLGALANRGAFLELVSNKRNVRRRAKLKQGWETVCLPLDVMGIVKNIQGIMTFYKLIRISELPARADKSAVIRINLCTAVRESIVVLSRSEASRPAREILRFAQDDTRGGSLG